MYVLTWFESSVGFLCSITLDEITKAAVSEKVAIC